MAVCIDIDGAPPAVLMLRGLVTVTEADGMLPEYAAAHRKTVGGQMSEDYLAAIDKPGLRMARIALRPSYAAILDFQERIAERTPEVVLAALQG